MDEKNRRDRDKIRRKITTFLWNGNGDDVVKQRQMVKTSRVLKTGEAESIGRSKYYETTSPTQRWIYSRVFHIRGRS